MEKIYKIIGIFVLVSILVMSSVVPAKRTKDKNCNFEYWKIVNGKCQKFEISSCKIPIYKIPIYNSKKECLKELREQKKELREQRRKQRFVDRLLRLKAILPRIFQRITTRCKKDSDCYITSPTYCLCNAGGSEIAVNKFGLKFYNLLRELKKTKEPYRCIQVYNCRYEEAICENRVCTLR